MQFRDGACAAIKAPRLSAIPLALAPVLVRAELHSNFFRMETRL
jgi:hypothetical protein